MHHSMDEAAGELGEAKAELTDGGKGMFVSV